MKTLHHSKRLEMHELPFGAVLLATLALLPTAPAGVFNDDLRHGIDPACWNIQSNQPLYTVAGTTEGVLLSKPAGGSYTFQYVALHWRAVAQGDFDVRAHFTNASITRVDGHPGNQVQLNAQLGGQYFGLVRSDEAAWGQNVHVWTDPPAAGFGVRAMTDKSGTMRIVRTGFHVQAYLNEALIHEANYNTNGATFWLSLQNNGTRDAIAVTFANFQIAADHIAYEPLALHIERLPPDHVLISWPAHPAEFLLESSPSLPGTGLWEAVTNSPALSDNRLFVTNAVESAAKFYRLKQGP
jgi:hypothetical protein